MNIEGRILRVQKNLSTCHFFLDSSQRTILKNKGKVVIQKNSFKAPVKKSWLGIRFHSNPLQELSIMAEATSLLAFPRSLRESGVKQKCHLGLETGDIDMDLCKRAMFIPASWIQLIINWPVKNKLTKKWKYICCAQ